MLGSGSGMPASSRRAPYPLSSGCDGQQSLRWRLCKRKSPQRRRRRRIRRGDDRARETRRCRRRRSRRRRLCKGGLLFFIHGKYTGILQQDATAGCATPGDDDETRASRRRAGAGAKGPEPDAAGVAVVGCLLSCVEGGHLGSLSWLQYTYYVLRPRAL